MAGMKKSKLGRPVAGGERKERYQVMLEPAVAERLRRLGDGNLSRGVALAVQKLKE